MEDISTVMDMTNEELVKAIQTGQGDTQALYERLYFKNLPLIKKCVRPFARDDSEVEDCAQEAYFGLYRAAQNYEDTGECKFMNFAMWYIRSALHTYKARSELIHVSQNNQGRLYSYKCFVNSYVKTHGVYPTNTEIAGALNISEKVLDRLKQLSTQISSLDVPVGDDGDDSLGDFIPDSGESPENVVVNEMYQDTLSDIWDIVERNVTQKQNVVIYKYFHDGENLQQIAADTGVTWQRCKQAKDGALIKLRSGRARFELMQKYEVAESHLYRSSVGRFQRTFQSSVEDVVIEREQAKEKYLDTVEKLKDSYRKTNDLSMLSFLDDYEAKMKKLG